MDVGEPWVIPFAWKQSKRLGVLSSLDLKTHCNVLYHCLHGAGVSTIFSFLLNFLHL